MSANDLSLDDAIEQYLGALTDRGARTPEQYGATLAELAAAYPGSRLSEFEPPDGTSRARSVLEQRWGTNAPRTFNRCVSVFRSFFAWHVAGGNLKNDPGAALQRKQVESDSRAVFTDDEREKIFQANPDPRDAVPLRLLFGLGVQSSTLRRMRFGDFDPSRKEVTITERRNRRRALLIDDPVLWSKLAELRRLRSADDDDYLLPQSDTRRHDPEDEELAAMDADGALDGGRSYFWKNYKGRWQRTTFAPKEPRSIKGALAWWYGCLWSAEIGTPGVWDGQTMEKARLTLGRELYAKGGMAEVRRVLGIVSRSSTHTDVYSDRDADQLDMTLRRVRQQYRPFPRASPDSWWKSPIRRLTDYIEEERHLVELSRVSIEMLRTQDADSPLLRDAAATLIRVVQPHVLIEGAHKESIGDHPQLHGHSLVAVWGAMETMTVDVVAAWLENWPAARQNPSVSEIKVSLAAFETMTPTERIDLLVQELEQKRPGARGIDRFDRLLDAVGLSGPRDSQLATNIYEMQQIRNVFAHKSGEADGRFAEACRHLGYRVGQRIVIDRHTWSDFLVNALLYAELVLQRSKEQLNISSTASPPVARPIRYVEPHRSATTSM